ncbi:MAG: hypothetical protein WCK77_03595 [Verrucomicrobiota bacterium]
MNQPPTTFCQSCLFESGLGGVVIARYKSAGRVEAGVFLVDVFCQGVKNAYFLQCHETELADVVERACCSVTGDPATEHSGAWGRKLIEASVAYARRLGFAPHRDYKQAARVMGGIDPKDCAETFVFGSDGKPLFVAGPNDSEARCMLILSVLTKKLGPPPAFHYIVPLDASDEIIIEGASS